MGEAAAQPITVYLVATSKNRGALGIFQAYGDEAVLTKCLDMNVGPRNTRLLHNILEKNGLRYGWLRAGDGTVVDEVMLGKPVEGMRVLMTHGGQAVRESVETFFRGHGIPSADDHPQALAEAAHRDELYDTLLAGCLTEAQAAAVLQSRERVEKGEVAALPANLLRTRRVVLAGAPNAGKSSLLNRLSGYDRAFVDAQAGATRDVVDELVDLAGYAVWIGDLPGYAENDAGLTAEAWKMAAERLRCADSVWFVHDVSQPWSGASEAAARQVAEAVVGGDGFRMNDILVILNKADLPCADAGEPWRDSFPGVRVVRVCSLPGGDALDKLEDAVLEIWE